MMVGGLGEGEHRRNIWAVLSDQRPQRVLRLFDDLAERGLVLPETPQSLPMRPPLRSENVATSGAAAAARGSFTGARRRPWPAGGRRSYS